MKKLNNKTSIFMMMLILVMLLVPSSVFAKETRTLTYKDGWYKDSSNGSKSFKGSSGDPVEISFDHDETIIVYTKPEDIYRDFCFECVSSNASAKYGKFYIYVSEGEQKILFKRLATSDDLTKFLVTAPSETTGMHYVQPGATYNDNATNMTHVPPLYKIVSNFYYNYDGGIIGGLFGYKGYQNAIISDLGNALASEDTNGSYLTSNDRVFVFAKNGLKEKELINFSPKQRAVNGAKIDFYKGKDDDQKTLERMKVTGAKLISSSDTNVKYNFDNDRNGKVIYLFRGITSEILDADKTNAVEKIISEILLSVGDLFRNILTKVAGKDLTIDSLIFNQYSKTILDFWGEGSKGKYYTVFQSVINGWYKAFSAWTQVILVMILIAMGIKAILLGGTAKQKKIQNMLVGWVLAVALLFFAPYFMKYSVSLNDALVKVFRNNSEYSVFSVYNTDFIERFGLSGDGVNIYQFGEDSTTESIKEQLIKMRDQIEDKYFEASGDMANARAAMESQIEEMAQIKKATERIDIIAADGSVNSFDVVYATINSWVEAGYLTLTPEQITQFVNDLVADVEVIMKSNNIFSKIYGGLAEWYLEAQLSPLLKDYAITYADYLALGGALEDVERAIEISGKGIDLEGTMRTRAGATNRLVFVLVWFLMIYQLILLLFLYYKRLVVVGVLIAIFPLIVMMYAIEKLMGIEKSQTLKSWLTEFIVNVFIQSVHAFIYIMLVETGLKIYENDSDGWLLFVIAVMAIFPMESLIKSIIGLDKAKTVKDLKSSAAKGGQYALMAAAAVKTVSSISQSNKAVDAKYNAKDAAADKKAERQDKFSELGQKLQENHIKRQMARGGDSADAQARLEQLRQQNEQKAETRKKKRDAAKRRRDRMRRAEKIAQPLRNIAAISSIVTTGLAGGGDVSDFYAGMAVAKVISGKNRSTKGSDNVKVSAKKDSAGGSTNQNTQTTGNNGGGANTNRAAEQARQATQNAESAPQDYGNGRYAQTAGEARKAARAERNESAIQDQFRQKIASRAQVDVNQKIFFGEDSQDDSNV